MDEPERRARGGSFGSVADVYERSRPGYPPEAVPWLLGIDPDSPEWPRYATDPSQRSGRTPGPTSARTPTAGAGAGAGAGAPEGNGRTAARSWPPQAASSDIPGWSRAADPYRLDTDPQTDDDPGPLTVVDLAAGTGALTRPIVAAGDTVIAVEPSRQMLGRLSRRVRAAHPVRGSAEAIPLVDGCADAVVVGQAFHWFDADRALDEIGRVLRSGGTLGLIWNRRDESVPWVRHLSRLLESPHEWDDSWAADLMETLEFSRWFVDVEHARFRLWQRLDREGLLQLVASRSYVATMSSEQRQELLGQVGVLFDMTANSPEGLILPYTSLCYRVRRI